MQILWSVVLLVLAVACTEANIDCRVVKLISRDGRRDTERASRGSEITSIRLIRTFTPGRCKKGQTYGFRPSSAYARDNCKGIFKICEQVRTTPAPRTTTEAPKEFCKTISLWSNPGKTERTTIEGRDGGDVTVQSLELLREISKGVCKRRGTYNFRRDQVYVSNGCEGKFRVCYTEDVPATTPAPRTTEKPREFCKTVTLWSSPGRTERTTIEGRDGGDVTVQSFRLLKEISKGVCERPKTYNFRRDQIYVSNGCEGKFRVCYTEDVPATTPAPRTTEKPREFCKTVTLWSSPGRTERTTIEGRDGGDVTVTRFRLVKEISRGVCERPKTYNFRRDQIYVSNGCEGKFRVCYTEEVQATTPAPRTTTTERVKEYCKTVTLWSRSGRTERTTIEGRRGGTVTVQSFRLLKEISRGVCKRRSTYNYRRDQVYVSDGCDGKFRVCYEERY